MLALALSVAIVGASGGAPTLTADTAARAAFLTGQELFRAAKYSEAVTQFERAYEFKPHAAIHFNIARCHEELGHVPQALRSYRIYLHERPDAADREEVLASVGALERKLKSRSVPVQQLMVVAEPADAFVFIDGASLGRSPAFIELDPGEHRVRIERAGLETISRTFVMTTTKSMELTYVLQPPALPAFALEPLAPPTPPPSVTVETRSYPLRSYAWLPMAVTALGGGLAAAGFVVASGSARDLNQELADQGSVTPRAGDLATRGQTAQTLAWAGVGVAGVGAVASIVFLAVSNESRLSPTIALLPGGSATIGVTGALP